MSRPLDIFHQTPFPDFQLMPLAISNSGLVVAIILVVLSLDYAHYARQRRRLGNIAVVGDASYLWRRFMRWTEDKSGLLHAFQRGYDTSSKTSKPWAFWGQHDDFIVVVPPGTCEEIKNVGLNKLSLLQAVEDSFHFGRHSNILGRVHVDAIRQAVNKNMNQLHMTLVAQSDKSIPQVLDSYARNREPFAGFMTIWYLVHAVTTSYTVGSEFSGDAEYLEQIRSYGVNVPAFVDWYFGVPAPLRTAFWYLSPQGYRVRATVKKLKAVIVPEIRRTIDTWRQTGRTGDQYTLLGAMLELKGERGHIKREAEAMDKAEEERQVQIFSDEVIFTGFDGPAPIAFLVTQMLFESIHRPEIAQLLRNEIAAALAASDGEWPPEAQSLLPRLESFTRETMRVNGPTLFSVTRSVLEPMTLKSGLALSPGTIISSPAWFVHNDEANYPRASDFSPWRFYDEKTNTATTKATTVTNTFLGFGYGSQVCPGRVLGVRSAQILFAKILMRYDAEFADGQKGRPENVFIPGQLQPPFRAKIVLKEREST